MMHLEKREQRKNNMTTWLKQKVSEIAIEQLIRYTPTSTENLPYVGLEHIEEGTLKLNSIGSSDEVKSQKKKFYKGDILYGSLRPYFRKVIKAKFDGVSSTDITVLKPKVNVDRNFLFYLVASQEFINKASMASNGTKMPRAGWKIVKDFVFDIPEPKIQSKIGLILSAYDDLIENNEKRIRILVEMAQRLYYEWFVKFKFPGHEKVKMVDSPLGEIPETWEVKKVKDSFNFIGGGTPSRKENAKYWQTGLIDWYTPTDLSHNAMFINSSSEKITEKGLAESSAKLFPEFSVMMTSRATIGRLSINTKPATTNQGFIVCIPNQKVPLYFLYYWLKHNVGLFIKLGTGATFKEITKCSFGEIKLFTPDKELTMLFQQTMSKFGSEILNLQLQIQNLEKTRELLIPQLVAGKRKLK